MAALTTKVRGEEQHSFLLATWSKALGIQRDMASTLGFERGHYFARAAYELVQFERKWRATLRRADSAGRYQKTLQ